MEYFSVSDLAVLLNNPADTEEEEEARGVKNSQKPRGW